MNKNLYEFIIKGNIENSLECICNILLINNNIIELEETLINICSYIGIFVTLDNITKYNDILESTKNLIEDDNINIKEYLILITKMCILCDIYNKHPTVKTVLIPINKLREKILDVFNDNYKLSSNGIIKFNIIIPPSESDSYQLSLKIIICLLSYIKSKEVNSEKLRNCFDYIIRRKYIFETQIIDDPDSIWFLWGFISILYTTVKGVEDSYWLFNYNFKKTKKKNRIGLLYSCAINIVYEHNKNESNFWNKNELIIIEKINDMAYQLINEVKKKINLNQKNEIKIINNNSIKNDINTLEFIYSYIPRINVDDSKESIIPFKEETKNIYKD